MTSVRTGNPRAKVMLSFYATGFLASLAARHAFVVFTADDPPKTTDGIEGADDWATNCLKKLVTEYAIECSVNTSRSSLEIPNDEAMRVSVRLVPPTGAADLAVIRRILPWVTPDQDL